MVNKIKQSIIVLTLLFAVFVSSSFALEVSVGGMLSNDNRQDEYSIYVEAGELIGVALNCVSGPLDPYLEVYGPNGFYREDDDGGSDYWDCDGRFYSSALSFRAPVTGVYTIVATSYPAHYNAVSDTDIEGGYSLTITGEFEARFSYNQDGRLNLGYGDLYAVLYSVADASGNPAINVYCFTGETWELSLSVVEGSGDVSASVCSVDVYALADGTYQFNINYDGKLYEIRCADLTCVDSDSSYFDPNE